MKKFIWASAHKPTPEQIQELGEVEYLSQVAPELQEQLNNTPSDLESLIELADKVLQLAYKGKYTLVQVGGSPAFQVVLGHRNHREGGPMITLAYAHSERVSQDEPQADGSVKKISIFKHNKFIQV